MRRSYSDVSAQCISCEVRQYTIFSWDYCITYYVGVRISGMQGTSFERSMWFYEGNSNPALGTRDCFTIPRGKVLLSNNHVNLPIDSKRGMCKTCKLKEAPERA